MSVRWDVDRSQVDAELADAVDAILAPDEKLWVIHFGFRTREEQDTLYKRYKAGKGGLAAPPGHSAHEFRLAVDFHEEQQGRADWVRGPDYDRIIAAVDASPTLVSGAHFPQDDFDHIQSVKWYAKRRELKEAGLW